MNDQDGVVKRAMARIRENEPLEPGFHEFLVKVARDHLRRGESMGVPVGDAPEDLAGDFFIHLAGKPDKTNTIESQIDVRREFRKWVTGSRAASQHELWTVISEALRALEKAGEAARAENQRKFTNSNATRWARPTRLGKLPTPIDEKEFSLSLPVLSAKNDVEQCKGEEQQEKKAKEKQGKKVLSPTEARKIVGILLDMADGELTMKEIVDYVRRPVPLMHVVSVAELSPENREDGSVGDPFERLAAEVVYPDLDAFADEEVDYRVEQIWRNAGEIERGGGISGRRILCCYWVPKNVAGKKVTLAEFGPTSTVQNVVDDIKRIMRTYVPTIEGHREYAAEHSACLKIGLEILRSISRLCSENGLCRSFYKHWSL